ncbi:MAG: molybdate ABC transporter substrate-binding protein [Pirellulaceae bacterium]
MSKTWLAVLGSILLIGGMLYALSRTDSQLSSSDSNTDSKPAIVLFCAASNRAVMEQIRADYEAETGRHVVIQYGASQTLLSQLELAGAADLYLPADDSFLKMGDSKELLAERLPIAQMHCGAAVTKGNPLHIEQLSDLLFPKVRLVQANPDATAVGKLTKQLLSETGSWDELDRATLAYRGTVTDVTNDLVVGAADAGIVYDAVLHTYPDLEFIALPELAAATSKVAIAVVSTSERPTAALHFARYVAAADRGLKHYAEHGFTTEVGDAWADVPELAIYAGSMLRPAIEDTIVAFEQREGVSVSRVYNGCGILVAQMKAGQHPDAYFACDKEFMQQVTDLFPTSVDVSQNELVILVAKGNPKNITSLRDLTREGLRVGVGHEKQCAMGWITQNTFRDGGIQQEVMANVTVQSPTGDMLVNQLRTGSLDAAVAYLSNAAGSAEFLDLVPIDGIACSTATQPWAVARDSQHPQLAGRLFDAIRSAESQEIFAAEGFTWQLP